MSLSLLNICIRIKVTLSTPGHLCFREKRPKKLEDSLQNAGFLTRYEVGYWRSMNWLAVEKYGRCNRYNA